MPPYKTPTVALNRHKGSAGCAARTHTACRDESQGDLLRVQVWCLVVQRDPAAGPTRLGRLPIIVLVLSCKQRRESVRELIRDRSKAGTDAVT